jgi:phosphate-selective porin OprO/OprP
MKCRLRQHFVLQGGAGEMANKSAARRRCYGALVAFCAATIPTVASAQDASIERIEAIERQIRALQGELKQLKGELGAAKQQLQQSRSEAQRSKEELRQAREAAERARHDAATAESQAAQSAAQAKAVAAAPPAPAPGGVRVGMPDGRPTISTSDGRLSFAIGMQVQFDMGTYYQNSSKNTQFPDLNTGVNLRRGRIFFVGKYDDFVLNFTPDFGGSPDGANTFMTLYEANLNFTGFQPVIATVGYFKPWFSLYDSQSSNDFLLMERPSVIEIARNVAAGDARASGGAKAATDQFFVGGYLTGAPYGAQSASLLNGEQIGMVGRLAGRPYYDKDWNVHLDLDGEYVVHPNINLSPPNGVPGVSRTTFNLQDRPELRIDMNRLISTGNLSISNVNVYGGEVGINWRNLLVQGGYYHIGETQSKLPGVPAPDLNFNGGYVEAGWVVTGEPIRYAVGAAAFARPKVDNPFTITERGIGAWELSARWSVMNLNSNVTPGVSQTVTGGIYGGFQQIFGAALSWYPNDWVRLVMQFQYTQVDKLNSAGTVQIGQKFETLAGRVQVSF